MRARPWHWRRSYFGWEIIKPDLLTAPKALFCSWAVADAVRCCIFFSRWFSLFLFDDNSIFAANFYYICLATWVRMRAASMFVHSCRLDWSLHTARAMTLVWMVFWTSYGHLLNRPLFTERTLLGQFNFDPRCCCCCSHCLNTNHKNIIAQGLLMRTTHMPSA